MNNIWNRETQALNASSTSGTIKSVYTSHGVLHYLFLVPLPVTVSLKNFEDVYIYTHASCLNKRHTNTRDVTLSVRWCSRSLKNAGTCERPLNIAALPSLLLCGPVIVMLHTNPWPVCIRAIFPAHITNLPLICIKKCPTEQFETADKRVFFTFPVRVGAG